MNKNERIPALLIISGPTASGKSTLAEALARQYDLPVISADSRQVYRYFDIGTAKPSPEIRADINYEMIDILEPKERFSAGKFAEKASHLIQNTYQNKPIIIIAGGTGFYISALINGLADIPEISSEIDQKWDSILETEGLQYLQKHIARIDPLFLEKGDLDNPRRVLRALKITDQTGRSIFDYQPQSLLHHSHPTGYFVIHHDRAILYDRINHRVDQMIEHGLVEEAYSLLKYQDYPAMRSVGYQELLPYFKAQVSLAEATDKIKQHSRNYAKRQLTWLRKHHDWTSITPKNSQPVTDWIEKNL